MAVPMSMTMIGWGVLLQGRHGGGHNVRPQLVVDPLARMFIPVFTPGPTIMGRTPLSWRMAPAMAWVMGAPRWRSPPGHLPDVCLVEVKHIQQVDGQLVLGFVLVGFQGPRNRRVPSGVYRPMVVAVLPMSTVKIMPVPPLCSLWIL